MPTPVRGLSIVHPDLPNPVTVPLPWESFPEGQQRELDRLDSNDDGIVSYTPLLGGGADAYQAEVQHSDPTAGRLAHLFWAYASPSPHNQRTTDIATLPDRTATIRSLQQALYDNAVLPILGDRSDPGRWQTAKRVLEETGDFAHLYRLGLLARARWEENQDIESLRIAEDLLLTAKRFAAMSRGGRAEYLDRIDRALAEINRLLDREDERVFEEEIKSPSLLTAMGSPVTADLAALQRGERVFFGVAVPASFVRSHPQDLEAALVRFFNEETRPSLKRSAFQDRSEFKEYPLTAVQAERDRPGPADDRIDRPWSFHIRQDRLNRVLFGDRERVYFRVGFQLPEAAQALGDREIAKFDLLVRYPDHTRRTAGGFVLQNKSGRTSRDVFAADIHVSERDYEIVKVMAESLLTAGRSGDRRGDLIRKAEAIERFYEPINERVEAAIELWNEAYRRGEIDRVFLAGDLADFVNIAVTLEKLPFRGTNVRRLQWILQKFEGPLYVASGNHDHHGYPFPLDFQRRNFFPATGLQDLYATHYDPHRFSGLSYWNGVKALLPASCSDDASCLWNVVREVNAEDPFGPPNDEFLNHHLREIGTYETYGVGLGNGFRVFVWPTETEHFNYTRYLLEEVHEPVGRNVLLAAKLYFDQRHASGKGPLAENFVAFLNELETAGGRGERVILMGHYPPFYAGTGPDQTPESEDALRGDAALALRLASWYYRTAGGDPVLALSITGHVHHHGEADFTFQFRALVEDEYADAKPSEGEIRRLAEEKEAEFRQELGRVLARKDTQTIFADLHRLRMKWKLDDLIQVRRVRDPGSDGFPGPIVTELNQGSRQYGQRRGTAFVNLLALGPSSEPGYTVVTTSPDGRITIAPRFLRIRPHGEIATAEGQGLEAFRRGHWQEGRAWDRTRPIDSFEAHTEPTAMTVQGPRHIHDIPRVDVAPLVCQYPKGKVCLDATVGLDLDVRQPRLGVLAGGRVLIPLSREVHSFIGGPNYLAVGGAYTTLSHDLRLHAGLDFGLVTPSFVVDRVTRGDPVLGGELLLHGTLPSTPAIALWGGSDLDGDWGAGFRFVFSPTLLSVRP